MADRIKNENWNRKETARQWIPKGGSDSMRNKSEDYAEFTKCAEEFCGLIENRDKYKPRDLLRSSAKILSRLNLLAHELPDVEFESDSIPENVVTEAEWNVLYKKLGAYFGKDDHYVQMFDPTEIEEEKPVGSSLSDDFADIYRDLKRGLALLGVAPINDIVWDWRFNFKVHWGNHLTSSLSAIHHILFKEID